MPFASWGVDYTSLGLDERELLQPQGSNKTELYRDFKSLPGVEGFATLFTCNRTEFYFEGQDLDPNQTDLLMSAINSVIVKYFPMPEPRLREVATIKWDDEAIDSLILLASGLRSQIMGEPEIMGQVGACYREAQDLHTLSHPLHVIFRSVQHAAKRVRTETEVGRHPLSIGTLVVEQCATVFESERHLTVLSIGTGYIGEVVQQHLLERGNVSLIVASRSPSLDKAQAGVEPVFLSEVPQVLHRADVVISSTASPNWLITSEMAREAQQKRQQAERHLSPSIYLDLAVPRDIDPSVGKVAGIVLLNLDQLSQLSMINQELRESERNQASEIIREELADCMQSLALEQAGAMVVTFRTALSSWLDQAVADIEADLTSDLKRLPEESKQLLKNLIKTKVLHRGTLDLKDIYGQLPPKKQRQLSQLLQLLTDEHGNSSSD